MRPEKFFLRVRVAGGRIEKDSFISILNYAKINKIELIITARAQIELHNLTSATILKAYKYIQKLGLTTHQTLTDNFRNIVTSPFDGRDSKIETYPLILEMQRRVLDNPEFFGMLPRKFNTALCGDSSSSFNYFGNDLYFGLAKKNNKFGFNLYIGGKNSQSASDMDIFVTEDRVVDIFLAVSRVYLKYGPRDSRAKSRIFYLLERVGVEGLRELISDEFGELESKGVYQVKRENFQLSKGDVNCYQSRYGVLNIDEILVLIESWAEVWFGIDQNIYYIKERESKDKIDILKRNRELASVNITACAGSRYCPLSLWDIKDDTNYLPIDLIKKYSISVGISGCLKGCGRHHFSDIGIVGLRTNIYGKTAKVQGIFLGGVSREDKATPARLIFYAIPLESLKSFLTLVIEESLRYGFDSFEEFSINILNRYSEGFLMVWFLSKIYLKHNLLLDKDERFLIKELQRFEKFPKIEIEDNYIELVNTLKHTVWDYRD